VKASRVADADTSTGPLLLWLGIQLGVLALSAARVPLAAQYAEPAEWLAPHLLLSAQVIASGLLFPFILRNLRTSVQILATAIPFQLAAAYLAGLGAADVLQAAGFVQAWLVTLAIGVACLRSLSQQMLAVCAMSCLTLGGATLRYLNAEFGKGLIEPSLSSASPLLTTLAAVEGTPTFHGWMTVACLAVTGIATLAVRYWRWGERQSPQRHP